MEPFGRNTAPAVALTAMKLVNEGNDGLMLVLPADHVIEDQKALQRALALATVAAERGEMVLFGVPANKPETGYGYIKSTADALLPEGVSRVSQFVEKPDEKRAQNSSKPVVTTGTAACSCSAPAARRTEKHDPDIYDTCLLTSSAACRTATRLKSTPLPSPAARTTPLTTRSWKNSTRLRRTAVGWLERCRLLVVAVGSQRQGRQRQRHQGRRRYP